MENTEANRQWGIEQDWRKTASWLIFRGPIQCSKVSDTAAVNIKCPEIPVLKCFDKDPGEGFWSKFPSKELPKGPVTPICIEKFESIVNQHSKKMTCHQLFRAKRCLESLKKGAQAYQSKSLPGVFTKNSPSLSENGILMTDTIGVWIKKGIVSGPFRQPPLAQFRVNPLMAIVQHGKVRPILNVSEPAGRSLNDNVDTNKLEKVYMSSAADFGRSLYKAGRDSVFSKFDLSDAYKIIPAKIEDLRLQGFSWLNRFFVEDRQIFGARASVCNFDIMGHTLLDIVTIKTGINPCLVHRRLDDVPVIGKKDSEWCELFSQEYMNTCKEINLSLAPACPKKEKAFVNEKEGTVLGIRFHSSDLSWSLPQDKKNRCLAGIKQALESKGMSLLEMQKLMGRLNDVGHLCPFLKIYRQPLNNCLSWLQNNIGKKICLPDQAKADLWVWAGMLTQSDRLPIPFSSPDPPLRYIHLTSDAAGVPEGEENEGAGVGGIGLDEEGIPICCFQEFWGESMITEGRDSKGARFGSKTSTLEMVGLVIPFLIIPDKLKNKTVVMTTDNIGCVFGWENKAVKGDYTASILVRAMALMSVVLKCSVYVRHEKRKSSWEGCLADRLTRKDSTSEKDRELLKAIKSQPVPRFFREWMDNPTENMKIAEDCLDFILSKM